MQCFPLFDKILPFQLIHQQNAQQFHNKIKKHKRGLKHLAARHKRNTVMASRLGWEDIDLRRRHCASTESCVSVFEPH